MEIEEQNNVFYKPKWEYKAKGHPHPSRRWCHTTTIYKNYLYILGGRLPESAKSKEYVYKINLQTFNSQPIILSDTSMMRESHSCSLINQSLYVLFGINKASKILNDCLMLKIIANNLVLSKKQQKNEIQPRQSHMSVILENRYILIYGGVDNKENLIQNFFIYDIELQIWKKVRNVNGQIQIKVGGVLTILKNQIYLFGGQKNDQNQYSNEIYKIQIKNYQASNLQEEIQITINKLSVIGPQPSPRSQFASAVYKDRFLIILGGQGSSKQKNETPNLMNDIWAFDTLKCFWQQLIPQNSQLFKPRSSFTASVYKDSLIIFGGLVTFKQFKTTDQIFVLHLNTDAEKRPICNICKSSYKMIPKIEPQIQKPISKITEHKFSTGFSTIFSISQTIIDPFAALGNLLHSLDFMDIQKCLFTFDNSKLGFYLKKMNINQSQWKQIYSSYQFCQLIQQSDHRVQKAIKNQVRKNRINYFSYSLKNSCFRLGNQFLITWMNSNQQLQLCLISKFGIYHTINLNEDQYQSNISYPCHSTIIFQFIRQNNLKISQILQNSMTIIVTSLKNSFQYPLQKQIILDNDKKDLVSNKKKFKHYLNSFFAQKLTYNIQFSPQYHNQSISRQKDLFQTEKIILNPLIQNRKTMQLNQYPQLFEKIQTYEIPSTSLMRIYQNNKLMHCKIMKNEYGIVYQFHVTKDIQPNLTFTDLNPTKYLLNSLKQVINRIKIYKHKRNQPIGGFENNELNNLNDYKENFLLPKKAVKTNSCQNDIQQQNRINEDIQEISPKI